VDVEPEHVLKQRGVVIDGAVHAIDVPAKAARAVGMLGEIESELPHVGVDRPKRLSHDRGTRVHRRRAPVAFTTRSQHLHPHALLSALQPASRIHRRIDVVQRELDDMGRGLRQLVELHDVG
jgi:hypothetical protein